MVEEDKSEESRGGERQEEGQEPSETGPTHPSRDQTRRMTLEGAVESSIAWTLLEGTRKNYWYGCPTGQQPQPQVRNVVQKKWMSVQNMQGTKNLVPMREYERHLIILKYSC